MIEFKEQLLTGMMLRTHSLMMQMDDAIIQQISDLLPLRRVVSNHQCSLQLDEVSLLERSPCPDAAVNAEKHQLGIWQLPRNS